MEDATNRIFHLIKPVVKDVDKNLEIEFKEGFIRIDKSTQVGQKIRTKIGNN